MDTRPNELAQADAGAAAPETMEEIIEKRRTKTMLGQVRVMNRRQRRAFESMRRKGKNVETSYKTARARR